jgi:hypothetical protein
VAPRAGPLRAVAIRPQVALPARRALLSSASLTDAHLPTVTRHPRRADGDTPGRPPHAAPGWPSRSPVSTSTLSRNDGMNRTVEPIHRSADPPTELARQTNTDQLQPARAKGIGRPAPSARPGGAERDHRRAGPARRPARRHARVPIAGLVGALRANAAEGMGPKRGGDGRKDKQAALLNLPRRT